MAAGKVASQCVAQAALVAQALEPMVDYTSVMVGNNNRLEARVRHWPPTPAPPGLFRGTAHLDQAAVELANARGVAGGDGVLVRRRRVLGDQQAEIGRAHV